MKIKMYDSVYMDMQGHPIVKFGYCIRRVAFNKKRKMKHTTAVSDEFHLFKIWSDKQNENKD